MTGKERIEKAFRHVEPDRVPVWEMAFNESSIIGIASHFIDDLPPVKLVHDMSDEEKLVLLSLLFIIIDELGLDGFPSLVSLDSQADGTGFIRDAWGCVFQRARRENRLSRTGRSRSQRISPPSPGTAPGNLTSSCCSQPGRVSAMTSRRCWSTPVRSS